MLQEQKKPFAEFPMLNTGTRHYHVEYNKNLQYFLPTFPTILFMTADAFFPG